MELRRLGEGVHVAESPQRFMGIEVGARMTVLEVDGALLVHSPIAIDPAVVGELGRVRWVLAPNLLHHLYVAPWLDGGAEAWGAPGLQEKRRDLTFAGVPTAENHPFGDEVALLPMTNFPMTQEIALLHRPSRTLVVSDLVYNFGSAAPWTTRVAMRALGGYPGCRTSLLERWGMRREAARRELRQLATWDFDRLIMAHGEVVESGGKAALLKAFQWLGPGLHDPNRQLD